jgi:membrane protein required for colicin V production
LVVSGVTQFDFLVAALLLISAAVGFARGAAREIAALTALIGAAAFAVFGLPLFAPMMRQVVHPDWLATVATLISVFIVTYIALRLVGGALAGQIQRSNFIGALDRSVGLALGLARGLIVLGALNLMFNAATPKDLQPHWITGATTWPLAQNMGRLLTALAPKGLDIAGRLKPAFDRAVGDALGDRTATDGYDARQRGEIDDLVEKSR